MNKKQKDEIHATLDKIKEDLSIKHHRELEKLVFGLISTNKILEDDLTSNNTSFRNKIQELNLDLEKQKLEKEQLKQALTSRIHEINILGEKITQIDKLLNEQSTINFDKIDLKLLKIIINPKQMIGATKRLITHFKQNVLDKIARISKNTELTEIFSSLNEDQIQLLVHMGFSELMLLKTLCKENFSFQLKLEGIHEKDESSK